MKGRINIEELDILPEDVAILVEPGGIVIAEDRQQLLDLMDKAGKIVGLSTNDETGDTEVTVEVPLRLLVKKPRVVGVITGVKP